MFKLRVNASNHSSPGLGDAGGLSVIGTTDNSVKSTDCPSETSNNLVV